MRTLDHEYMFATAISFPGLTVDIEPVEVNVMDMWQKPVLPKNKENYTWKLSVQVGADTKCSDEYDEFTIYLNATLNMTRNKYHVVTMNTLHGYHISKLQYHQKKYNRLFRTIIEESLQQAGILLSKAITNTEYEGFLLPAYTEAELDALAADENFRNYVQYEPDEEQFTPVPKELRQPYRDRINELVKLMDDYDDREDIYKTEITQALYNEWFTEWSKLYPLMMDYHYISAHHVMHLLANILCTMETSMHEKNLQPEGGVLKFYKGVRDLYIELEETYKGMIEQN